MGPVGSRTYPSAGTRRDIMRAQLSAASSTPLPDKRESFLLNSGEESPRHGNKPLLYRETAQSHLEVDRDSPLRAPSKLPGSRRADNI